MGERLKPAGSDCERCHAYEPVSYHPGCELGYKMDKGACVSLEPCPYPIQFRKYLRLLRGGKQIPASTQPTGTDDQEEIVNAV